MLNMSWFRTHIRLTVAGISIMLLLATTVTVFVGHLSSIHADNLLGHKNSKNWTGNEAVASRGTYTQAKMDFIVPTITGSPAGDRVSVWAGLGGDPDVTTPSVLVQAGVDSYIDDSGNQVNTPWWSSAQVANDLPMGTINAGDTIEVIVSSNLIGDNQDVFTITDETTNDPYTFTLVGGGGLSDSATAECIVERVGISGGSPPPLAQFGTININNCLVDTNMSETGIGNTAHEYLILWDGSTDIAEPGAISADGNSFPVYWYNRT